MARKTDPAAGIFLKLTAALLFLLPCLLLPDLLLAARLELRHGLTGPSEVLALVGDEFEVVLWVDSEGESLSGATIFLSFDDSAFELVAEDRDPDISGYQPFAPGAFLRNGDNYRNTLLDPADPAAAPAGAQLDYSVVSARDKGAGPAASFRLRATAPVRNSVIRIDESGIRETRFFMPDGTFAPRLYVWPFADLVLWTW